MSSKRMTEKVLPKELRRSCFKRLNKELTLNINLSTFNYP